MCRIESVTKQLQLDQIASEIDNCKICKKDKIGVAVPGEGNPDADIVFIGEAPGKQEAVNGRPFIGRSGQLLRNLIREIGLDDIKDVYIPKCISKKNIMPSDVIFWKVLHLFD